MLETCPICNSNTADVVLRRPGVPVHQNLVFSTEHAAREIKRGDLDIAVCAQCGFVFNAAFDLELLSYGASYDNNQACSATFRTYLEGLVDHLVDECGVRNCRIVDVGCGNGDFLRRLVNAPGSGNTGVGFDPAYAGPEFDCDGRVRFERRYYGPECADIVADVVICRHVIEHVPRPVDLLRTVHAALQNSPNARVYFETPDVNWILRNSAIWDLFYEHCSLFTAQSLTTAFETAGFRVSSVDHIFCGQYLWIEAVVGSPGAAPSYIAADVPALAHRFAIEEANTLQEWSDVLDRMASRGRVALWGAGAKGVTFANLLDRQRRRIDCVVDLNPKKQGGFVPGTGHPIVDFRSLPSRNVTSAILMNPNYLGENEMLLSETGISLELIGTERP